MLKPALTILVCLFIYQMALAQKDTSVFYLKSSGKVVATKHEADFYIKILPVDKNANKNLYPVNGYYLNGKTLFAATSLTNSLPLKLQGSYTAFSVYGYKITVRNYDHGELTGDILTYYPNGRFYNKQTYITTMDTTELQFIDCTDSTGKVMTVKGNGNWITFNDIFSRIIEKGKIVNGLQDSIWQISPDINNTYSILYKNGKIIEDDNPFIPGNLLDKLPEFPGGDRAYGNLLTKNIKYPEAARKNNTQGKVIVSFIVERDGSLTNIRILKGIGSGCDEEAVRVIQLSPKWKPAMQYGKPVRAACSAPINFVLGSF